MMQRSPNAHFRSIVLYLWNVQCGMLCNASTLGGVVLSSLVQSPPITQLLHCIVLGLTTLSLSTEWNGIAFIVTMHVYNVDYACNDTGSNSFSKHICSIKRIHQYRRVEKILVNPSSDSQHSNGILRLM